MSAICWPSILQETDSIDSLFTRSGFWITSPSILEQYPELRKNAPFVVKQADFETLLHLQKCMREYNYAFVYAIGGGKVLDLAKLAVRLGELEASSYQALAQRKWIERSISREVSLTVIPTTAGTGSEVSEVAVLTISGQKVPIYHPSLLSDHVIANVQFIRTLPERVLWNGLWDTLVHALESAVSPLATKFTKMLSWEVLRSSISLIDNLLKNKASTEDQCILMQWNSIKAGKAQSLASVGLAHALGHQSELERQWHGEACARIIPRVTELNAEKMPEKYEELAKQAGLENSDKLIIWLKEKASATVGEYIPSAIPVEQRSELVKRIMKDPCYRTNAAYISKVELTEWLERWFYV